MLRTFRIKLGIRDYQSVDRHLLMPATHRLSKGMYRTSDANLWDTLSSGCEHVVAHLLRFQFHNGPVQHALLVHAARVNA